MSRRSYAIAHTISLNALMGSLSPPQLRSTSSLAFLSRAPDTNRAWAAGLNKTLAALDRRSALIKNAHAEERRSSSATQQPPSLSGIPPPYSIAQLEELSWSNAKIKEINALLAEAELLVKVLDSEVSKKEKKKKKTKKTNVFTPLYLQLRTF